jgi:hypothetical protein
MSNPIEGDAKAFAEYLRKVPTLDEASSGKTVTLTGVVFRSGEGRFAITCQDGQTLELEAEAVQRFKVVEGTGLVSVLQLEVQAEKLSAAAIKAVKPVVKDLHKDPIKDVHHDTLHAKDLHKDPITDKVMPKDLMHKEIASDPSTKEVATDGAFDPIGPGTGVADTLAEGPGSFDPGQVVNPAMRAGLAPFVMATPHQAPAHLIGLQAGAAAATLAAQDLKAVAQDTVKELHYETMKEPLHDTRKEMVQDTYKEMVHDTYKELVMETWVEGSPYTAQEGTFEPGGMTTQPPVWNFPGLMY